MVQKKSTITRFSAKSSFRCICCYPRQMKILNFFRSWLQFPPVVPHRPGPGHVSPGPALEPPLHAEKVPDRPAGIPLTHRGLRGEGEPDLISQKQGVGTQPGSRVRRGRL